MEFHTFGPGLALDPITMRGVAAMSVYLEDADTGDPVQAYTLDEDPAETTVRTNRYGYFPQFQVDASVRRLRIVVGEVELIHGAWELIYKAEASAAGTLTAAQAAQAAAEHAASLVEAPADIKVAELIRNEGTATQRILHGLYGARGNTFVQPTPPPAGTTYEWEGIPHASPSVKKIDGVAVARNLIVNPSFENGTAGISAGTSNTVINAVPKNGVFEWASGGGEYMLEVSPAHAEATSIYARPTVSQAIPVTPGEYVAVRMDVATNDPEGSEVRATAQFDYAGVVPSPGFEMVAPEGETKIVSGQVPEGVSRIYFLPWARKLNGNFSLDDRLWVDRAMIAFAGTEAEAIAQVADYFDGDMPDDRANDVWFNTTDNRQYTWDSDTKTWTQVPAGLNDTGIAALVEDTNSDTRGALDTAFGATAQNTITADALQAPGPVRDAFKQALQHYGATRAEGSPGARLVFGALRNYGSAGGYWQPIDDNGHDPVGIASVETTSDRITITTTPVDNGTIVGGSLIAVTDETLAKQGYFVGGSGGGGTTHLMLGRSFSITDRIWWDGSNWAFERGNFTLNSWASGHLRLDHPFQLHGRGGVNINWHATTSAAMVHPVLTAETNVQTVVNFYDTSGTRLTTPTSACRFYLTRHESMDAGQVDPRDVEYASGNIWFMLVQTYR